MIEGVSKTLHLKDKDQWLCLIWNETFCHYWKGYYSFLIATLAVYARWLIVKLLSFSSWSWVVSIAKNSEIIIVNSLEGSSCSILSQHCHGGSEGNHETWIMITGIKIEIQTGMSWIWNKLQLPVSAVLIYL